MENRPTILIVDDEPGLLFSLSAYLQDEDFQVTSISSGEEALALMNKMEYDLVIIDVRLPGKDGNQIIKEALQKGVPSKFMIHTGSTDYQIPASLQRLGISRKDVFFKPLTDLADFCQILRKRLKTQ